MQMRAEMKQLHPDGHRQMISPPSSISLLCFSLKFRLMSLKANIVCLEGPGWKLLAAAKPEGEVQFPLLLIANFKSKFPHEEKSSMSVCFSA
jgi:hypothetical protein